jgi:hypothetical protein
VSNREQVSYRQLKVNNTKLKENIDYYHIIFTFILILWIPISNENIFRMWLFAVALGRVPHWKAPPDKVPCNPVFLSPPAEDKPGRQGHATRLRHHATTRSCDSLNSPTERCVPCTSDCSPPWFTRPFRTLTIRLRRFSTNTFQNASRPRLLAFASRLMV